MSAWVKRGLLAAALGGLGLGCVGEIGGGGSKGGSGDVGTRPSPTDLRRLTAEQYRTTVIDVFAGVPALDVETVAASALSFVPADGTQDGSEPYTRMDGRLSPPHVEAYFEVADVIAQAFEASAEARSQLIGDCANDTALTDACIDEFLDGFAWRAFRRPLAEEERESFHSMNDGSHEGPELVRGLVFVALMSPQFLYHVEVRGAAIDGDSRYELDGYALASRLSYHFWGTMPDDGLFAAADDGSLLTEAGYQAQVDRVFEDPRTRAMAETFYRQWLRYDQVGGFKSSPVFEAFADDPAIIADGPGLLAAMHGEINELASYYTWEVDGDFRALLTSDVSLTTSPILAALYGVEPWDGSGEPPHFSGAERSGLLTRAAFLVTGAHETNPVLRGAIVRRRILCTNISAPSPSSLPPGSLDPPAFDPDMTTRQRYEEKTKNEPCASCHAQLNPIGFVLEQYDALGRYRTQERILDAVTGAELALLDLDTSAVPELTSGDMSAVSESPELMDRVADSEMVEACFAKNYFQFSWGKKNTAADDPAIERVESALARAEGSDGPGSLRAALRAIALDPSFRQRVVGE